MDVYAKRLSGLEVHCLKLAADMIGSMKWEFENYEDKSAFLKRKLVGFVVDRYQWVRLEDHTSRPVLSCILRASDLFLQRKKT